MSGLRFFSGTVILLVVAVHAVPAQSGAVLMAERFDTVIPPSLPAGWHSSRNRNALQDDFVSSASAAQSPPNALLSTNATIGQELFSPAISFRDRVPGTLRFSLRRSSTHCSNLLVEASTNRGADFSMCLGDTIRASGETVYQTTVFPLPALLQGLPEVVFRWRTIGGNTGASGTLRIDDVVITASVSHDVAVTGFRYEQTAARESSLVSVSVMVANLGWEPTDVGCIILGVDGDGDGTIAGAEILSRVELPAPPAPGETTGVVMEFRVPPAGEYSLMVFADSPSDQVPENNSLIVPFVAGYRRRAVVVNEIMYAPAGDEPEWIELFNAGFSDIPLGPWRIGDALSPQGKQISTVPVILPAGGIAVVARSPVPETIRPGCGTCIIVMEGFPSLNNGGDLITLRDGTGCIIDSVPYLPAWGGAAGHSLERRDERVAGDDGANWGSSMDSTGATPCLRNSIAVLDTDVALASCGGAGITAGEPALLHVMVRNVGRSPVAGGRIEAVELLKEGPAEDREVFIAQAAIPSPLGHGDSAEVGILWGSPGGGPRRLLFRLRVAGDMRSANDTLGLRVLVGYRDPFLRINEIMAVPRQGEAEYIEIQNAGPETIDIAGWTIGGRDGAGAAAKRFLLSREPLGMKPGACFILASDSSIFLRFAICDPGLVTVAGTATLQLNNDADAIVLRDGFGRQVDSVFYTSRWQSPALTDPAGRSLERISASLSSSDARNWGTCVAADGGTPGCPNSIRGGEPVSVERVVAAPNPFSPDGDGRDDHTMIRFEAPVLSGWMSIRIYDVRGRLVRFLANNEPCGAKGAVVWDGFDDRRRRVRVGVYIILLEVAGEDRAAVLTARGTVVVAGRLR